MAYTYIYGHNSLISLSYFIFEEKNENLPPRNEIILSKELHKLNTCFHRKVIFKFNRNLFMNSGSL